MENSELLEKRKKARERRKKTELKKRSQGLRLFSFYLNQSDTEYLMKVKNDLNVTNNEALKHIFSKCRDQDQ